MSKQSGALATRFQSIKTKYQLIKQLDRREIQGLVLEGVITLSAMVLIYLGCLFLFNKVIYQNTNQIAFFWRLAGINDAMIYWGRHIFTLLMLLLTIWFTQWRLARRYRQIELRHVLNELDYIAAGHYDYRISTDLVGRLGSVVESINKLVDSTVSAMAEERRVEATKNELITNVSHDIRTPLTSVIGYLSLIEEGQYDDIEELKTYVHIAYTKAQQMKVLADSLFEYTSLQQVDTQVNFVQIDIENFLAQIAATYDREASEAGMALILDVEANLPPCWMVPDLMVRVFDNLISNAFKYSHASRLILSARLQGDYVIFGVVNNGQAINRSDLSQLFVRFYRQDQARSSFVSGSGLGLAIVESIVLQHGGRVWAKSRPKQTGFYVQLPLTEKGAQHGDLLD